MPLSPGTEEKRTNEAGPIVYVEHNQLGFVVQIPEGLRLIRRSNTTYGKSSNHPQILRKSHIVLGSYLKDERLAYYAGQPYREYQSRVAGYPFLGGPFGRRTGPSLAATRQTQSAESASLSLTQSEKSQRGRLGDTFSNRPFTTG